MGLLHFAIIAPYFLLLFSLHFARHFAAYFVLKLVCDLPGLLHGNWHVTCLNILLRVGKFQAFVKNRSKKETEMYDLIMQGKGFVGI